MVSFDIILVASKRASFDRLEPIIFRGINGIDEITINDVVAEWNVHLKINYTRSSYFREEQSLAVFGLGRLATNRA